MAQAQAQTLSGSGTSDDPYLISSSAEWDIFTNPADSVKYWGSDVCVHLINNIPTADEIEAGTTGVTTMVGVYSATVSERRPYKGKFYGDDKTITVNYSNGTSGRYTAPFVCTKGAIINKLSVAGNITITNNAGYAAGVVGCSYGSSVTKINGGGIISVNITNGNNGSAGSYCRKQ